MKKSIKITGSAVLLLISLSCKAVYEVPQSRTTAYKAEFDKNSIHLSSYIWNGLSGGYDSSDTNKWSNNTLVCLSESDSTYGACPTRPLYSDISGVEVPESIIRLNFKNSITNQSIDVNIYGYHIMFHQCSNMKGFSTRPAYVTFNRCDNNADGKNDFYYTIPKDSIAKIPTPGIWKATLKQKLVNWRNGNATLGEWAADIELKITDVKTAQIYFPKFPSTSPLIDLNLNFKPGAKINQTVGGRASLDMCLYDGKGSSSQQIEIYFRDEREGIEGLFNPNYAVFLVGGDRNKPENIIDYQVTLRDPINGNERRINRGEIYKIENTNSRDILRQVVLPGVPGISLCVPAPIVLTTPEFRVADKSAGRYVGRLSVFYTPSTQSNTGN